MLRIRKGPSVVRECLGRVGRGWRGGEGGRGEGWEVLSSIVSVFKESHVLLTTLSRSLQYRQTLEVPIFKQIMVNNMRFAFLSLESHHVVHSGLCIEPEV